MQNIVVLVDLNNEGSWRSTLPVAIDYAEHTGAKLHILSIVPDEMFKMTVVAQLIPEDYERKLADEAKQRLNKVVEEFPTEAVTFNPVVRMGSVYKEALHFADEVGADLIVLGAHRPDLADFLLGSNAAQIVRHAPCSVWVVRDRS